ncbi:hypothetical protein Tsubulata_047868 [Turnera subulata]|uniref:Uncharacterized protein n=1 Tax=Turnera subulata TaxID=218843 RepID=A0A9Q0JL22_9ROSI|nr:hypothetical protein Tsubulata_047868 [Turnera subulata]
MAITEQSGHETPLLEDKVVVDGSVDYKGRPVHRYNSGGWRSATFIIGVEVAERFAYYGIESNLITFLTGPLGQSTATAAENVNAWSGTASLLPLLGGLLADSLLGRYRTILFASSIYISCLHTREPGYLVKIGLQNCNSNTANERDIGLGLLTLSALLPTNCKTMENNSSCSPSLLQVFVFFFSLYLVALGQGGHKPCVQAFGADQFDGKDPEESKAKSSFFNWWYFSMGAGIIVTLLVLTYIQDNIGWGFGFGIPCLVMAAALLIFLAGTKTYRYSIKVEEKSVFLRTGRVLVATVRNWRVTTPTLPAFKEEASGMLTCQSSGQFKFLNKALYGSEGFKCSLREVEEAKSVLRLVPIWASCLAYAVVSAQPATHFTKQGVTMDRSISPTFQVPAASLQCFSSISIITSIAIYDRLFVPLARRITQIPSGITLLQRIGTGMFLATLSMMIAALVEIMRLKTAKDYGLVDTPNATIPMSVWRLIPQNVLFGVSEAFTMVGLQEFFYDQVPAELRSVGLSLYLSIFGVGSFLSSFLISGIQKATGDTWFADNLNRAHLDYFYWLLTGLSLAMFIVFLYFAKCYIYSRTV